MAWTTPSTWVAGALVTEGDLNAQIRDNHNILKTSIDANGKIISLSSAYLADLSGLNLTGLAKLASANDFTGGKHNFNAGSGTRVVLPVGSDKWAT